MALAPAFIVSNMVSSEGPPVAIMGSFGYSFLILATIFGVSVEADTFNILAPAFILPSKSVSSLITLTILMFHWKLGHLKQLPWHLEFQHLYQA